MLISFASSLTVISCSDFVMISDSGKNEIKRKALSISEELNILKKYGGRKKNQKEITNNPGNCVEK